MTFRLTGFTVQAFQGWMRNPKYYSKTIELTNQTAYRKTFTQLTNKAVWQTTQP